MAKLTIGGTTKRSKFAPLEITFQETPQGNWEVDGRAIPAASVEFLFKYGLKQYLADGVAGAKSQAEFDAGVAERLDKVKSANFARSNAKESGPIEDVDVLARKLAKEAWTKLAKAKLAPEVWKGLSAEKRDEAWGKSAFGPEGLKFQGFVDEATRQIEERRRLTEEGDEELGLIFGDEEDELPEA